eukprot:COSAG01_NODE_1401_length_10450_cov_100.148198_8_plen_170_part_00
MCVCVFFCADCAPFGSDSVGKPLGHHRPSADARQRRTWANASMMPAPPRAPWGGGRGRRVRRRGAWLHSLISTIRTGGTGSTRAASCATPARAVASAGAAWEGSGRQAARRASTATRGLCRRCVPRAGSARGGYPASARARPAAAPWAMALRRRTTHTHLQCSSGAEGV